ncbi:MAG TPA: HPr family phosphocarrier protein [Ruminococcaceae bacterium]|nr:HPr family phosphocarrier protein [Oscillospiraceae bacterium]
METFQHTVSDPEGIHARPAGLLVKCAQSCGSNVTLSTADGRSADAKRLFAVMGLNVKSGETVTFTVEGVNEQAGCEKLKEFCRKNF